MIYKDSSFKKVFFMVLVVLLIIVAIFFITFSSSFASDQVDDKKLGEGVANKLIGNTDNVLTDPKTIGFEDRTSEIKEQNMSIEQLESLGNLAREQEGTEAECSDKKCIVSGSFSTRAMIERSDKIDQVGFRRNKQGEFEGSSGFLDALLDFSKNAKNEFDYLKGEYKNCSKTKETLNLTSMDTCDIYYDHTSSSCMPQQIVEIDPKYNYLCNKKREVKEKVCRDEIIEIKCKQTQNCSAGGLFTQASNNELMQVSGGLRLKQNGNILELGNERHWIYNAGENGCAMQEFTAKFYIKNLAQVANFKLIEVFENNLLHIAVNGGVIYNGIGGIDLILGPGTGFSKVIYGGNGTQGKCGINARHTHWKQAHYDILRAGLLKEGENHIHIKVVYHWYGHAGFKIEASNYCCNEFDIKREEKCEFF